MATAGRRTKCTTWVGACQRTAVDRRSPLQITRESEYHCAMPMPSLTTYAQIDLDAIAANVRALATRARGAEMFAVVKANAYGHGAIPVARTALESGATRLAVARIDEGIALRRAEISAPVLIMGYGLADEIAQAADHDLT